jgi:dienelactone hydrolase
VNRAVAMLAGLAAAVLLAAAGCGDRGVESGVEIAAPARAEYPPPAGKGRVVIILSGRSGPRNYRPIAAELAARGYYTVLLDGNDIQGWDRDGSTRLKATVLRAQQSANALPGKAAVIGFSLGGGGALAHATRLPDLVAAVVAWYPATYSIGDEKTYVAQIKVPTLILAGGMDRYGNCCLIGTMRALEAAARDLGKPLDLVVYPEAEHGFNLPAFGTYRPDDAADGLRRTTAMLRQYLGE